MSCCQPFFVAWSRPSRIIRSTLWLGTPKCCATSSVVIQSSNVGATEDNSPPFVEVNTTRYHGVIKVSNLDNLDLLI
jgi:hypothetical protein